MDTYEFLDADVIELIQSESRDNRPDRRGAERVAIDLNVSIKAGNRAALYGRASNMSMRGVFIELPDGMLPPSGKVELRSYQGDVMLCAIGDIVHMECGGVGVKLRAPVMVYEMIDGQHYPLDPYAVAV